MTLLWRKPLWRKPLRRKPHNKNQCRSTARAVLRLLLFYKCQWIAMLGMEIYKRESRAMKDNKSVINVIV